MSTVSPHAHSRKQNQNRPLTFQAAQERAKYLRRAATTPGLSPAALRLLIVLADMAHQRGQAWPRQATLAEELGLHLDTVQAALMEAEAAGLIQTRRGQRGKVYSLPWHECFRSGLQTGSDPAYRPDQNAATPYIPERTEVNAVVAAPPPLATTAETHPAEAPSTPTPDPELKTVRQAIQRHSDNPVSWADAKMALTAHGAAAVEEWAARRRGPKLAHAGAVLTVLMRDRQASAEADQAMAGLLVEDDRRYQEQMEAQAARWAAEEREYQARLRMPPQATSGPGSYQRLAAAGTDGSLQGGDRNQAGTPAAPQGRHRNHHQGVGLGFSGRVMGSMGIGGRPETRQETGGSVCVLEVDHSHQLRLSRWQYPCSGTTAQKVHCEVQRIGQESRG